MIIYPFIKISALKYAIQWSSYSNSKGVEPDMWRT